MVDELVGKAQLVDRGVDAGLAQHLTHARADAADADAVLDRDDEAVGCRELDDRRLHGHDPARVDDGRADPLRAQALGDLDREVRHRADADEQHVLRVRARQHVDAVVEALDRGQRRRRRRPSGSG